MTEEAAAIDPVSMAQNLEAEGRLQEAAAFWDRAAAARPGDDGLLGALTSALVRLGRRWTPAAAPWRAGRSPPIPGASAR